MSKEKISIIFEYDRKKRKVFANLGDTILEVAEKNKIPLKGACEGNGVCGTCHIIFNKKDFEKLPKTNEEEEDTLDLVPELTHYSRLACQVRITEKLNGLIIKIPRQNRNL